jgi:hypothetical protein
MKLSKYLAVVCLISVSAFGQGSYIHDTALKVVNGVMAPIPSATITVCPAAAAGIPCTPAGTLIYSNLALTQPLLNPFPADSFGNYQFAIAAGTYTVTVTASGFTGFSYQVSTPAGGASAVTWATLPGGTNSSANFLIGTGSSLGTSGTGTIQATSLPNVLTSFLPTTLPAGTLYMVTDATANTACTSGGGTLKALCYWDGATWTPASVSAAGGIVGTGASLTAQNTGQVAATQYWLPNRVADPATSQQNAGGSIAQNHTLNIQVTYNTALGESLPSVIVAQTSGAACGSICQVTVTAPTLPTGYLSYNVYACDTNAAGACSASGIPQKQASCTAITANCVLTSSPVALTSAAPTTNGAWIQPPGVQANNGAAPSWPSAFFPKADGNMYSWIGEDWESCDASSGPPLPCGTPMITHRTFFRDNSSKTQAGKNAFISINHDAGTGTVATNQDRAIWILMQNPIADVATRWAMEGLQVELDVNGTPTINGSPDGELSAGSYQLSDNHAGTLTSPVSYGANAIRAQAFRSGSGNYSSCSVCMTGINAIATNNNAASFNSGFMAGLLAQATDAVGCSSCSGVAVWAKVFTSRFAGSNFGVHIDNFGANVSDYNLDSQASNENDGKNAFAGNTFLNHLSAGNLSSRIAMTNPTCSFASGGGTSPSCAIRAGSTDSLGRMVLTTGTGAPAGTGTVTLNFHAAFVAPVTDVSCVATAQDNSGAWNGLIVLKVTAHSLSAVTFTWTNGATPTALSTSVTYDINYQCHGN